MRNYNYKVTIVIECDLSKAYFKQMISNILEYTKITNTVGDYTLFIEEE